MSQKATDDEQFTRLVFRLGQLPERLQKLIAYHADAELAAQFDSDTIPVTVAAQIRFHVTGQRQWIISE